ncbi:MAG: hypothetical protein ACO31I_01165 [Prochlorotrichaceae cyanobacterium]
MIALHYTHPDRFSPYLYGRSICLKIIDLSSKHRCKCFAPADRFPLIADRSGDIDSKYRIYAI